jgi:hypothetical protein
MTVDVEEAKAELIDETASQVREHLPQGDDAQAERFLASTRPRFRPTTSSSATTPARTRDPLGRAPDDRGPPRDEGVLLDVLDSGRHNAEGSIPESFIHIEVDRQTDHDFINELKGRHRTSAR